MIELTIPGEVIAKEIWKDIKGYEGLYQISNKGRVKSLARVIKRNNGRELPLKERIKNDVYDNKGYSRINLSKNGKSKKHSVHRLVANAFLIKQKHQDQVNHIDGDKKNNDVSNLEWCTGKENVRHSYAIGKASHVGERNTFATINDDIAREIIKLKDSGLTAKKVGQKVGASKNVVYSIWQGKTWTHVNREED